MIKGIKSPNASLSTNFINKNKPKESKLKEKSEMNVSKEVFKSWRWHQNVLLSWIGGFIKEKKIAFIYLKSKNLLLRIAKRFDVISTKFKDLPDCPHLFGGRAQQKALIKVWGQSTGLKVESNLDCSTFGRGEIRLKWIFTQNSLQRSVGLYISLSSF